MDSMEKDSKRCYFYDMKKIDYNTDMNDTLSDRLIIQMTLFGGSAFLHISGFNKVIYNNENEIKAIKNNLYQIISEKSIMLKEKDFKSFNEEYDSSKEGDKNKLPFS